MQLLATDWNACKLPPENVFVMTERSNEQIARLGASCASSGDSRGLLNNVKKLNVSCQPRSLVGVELEDGTLATCERDGLQRWVRSFQKLSSATVTRDPAAVVERCHHHSVCLLDPRQQQHCSGKSAGLDGLLVEVWRACWPQLVNKLVSLIHRASYERTLPLSWRGGLLVPLWKGSGDHDECKNLQGVMVSDQVSKIVTRILHTEVGNTRVNGFNRSSWDA